MKIYTVFICVNIINVEARNYKLQVPKSMSGKNLTSIFFRPLAPSKNMSGTSLQIIKPILVTYKKNSPAIARNGNDQLPHNELQQIYHKFMQGVNILKEQFPSDAIEAQLEIEKSNQNDLMESQKSYKIIKVHKRPVLKVKTPATKTTPLAISEIVLRAASETIPQATPQAVSQSLESKQSQATQNSQVILQTVAAPQNDIKRLVYKEDLDKAFSDFERKLSSTTTAKSGADNSFLMPIKLQLSTQPIHHYIQHIIKLLKKGVDVQSHGPHPSNSDLDWIQIKIPKQ